jgi:PAS domain S-box-containing protein
MHARRDNPAVEANSPGGPGEGGGPEGDLRADRRAGIERMVDLSPFLLAACERELRYRFVSRAYAAMIGRSREEIEGKPIIEILGADGLSTIMPYVQRVLAGERVEYETSIRYDRAGFRNLHVVYEPETDGAGNVTGWVASITDITERKRAEQVLRESEQRFRVVADTAPALVWMSSPDKLCNYFNKGWLDFVGRTMEQEAGNGWAENVHPDDFSRCLDVYVSSFDARRPFEMEYRLRHHTGEYRWILDRGVPLYAPDGTFEGYIGACADVHDQKGAMERAESAARAKDGFLAALSHELRTPLTPVLLAAAALRENDALPRETRDELAMIERNVTLEARLIDDLLDLTRITRGKLALRSECCDAHAVIGLAMEIVRDEARAKGIVLQPELTARRTAVTGDSARLQQVLWNLLRNSVKFTPAGGRISIRTLDLDAAGDRAGPRLGIEVRDNGIGFEPGMEQRIFEPFEQAAPGEHRFGGLGLGLAIARAIITAHDGVIRAESAGPGRGATFTIELPAVVPVAAPAADPDVAAARESSGAAPATPPLRLMVVEDHPATLDLLSRLLTRCGHTVTAVRTMSEALAAAVAQTFDAVVSDIGLPDGSGIELMRELRDRHGLRGIALSGYGMAHDFQRSRDAGFVAHLVKPVHIAQLRQQLDALVRNAQHPEPAPQE